MQTERMQRVYELFHEISVLPEPERLDALRQRCGDDEELYKEVQALLKTGVTQEAVTVRPDAMDMTQLKPGDVVGPYKILEQIGEGGFAIVYAAKQEKPVRRKVALKIIKLGMDTKQVIARFEAERQALAMMDHACVAKVFDAGATETGRPYFVMEYVPGDPITDYCDRHRLTTRQRLDLFIQACDAVQHAHQKGIIHRDIKPSNVLVAVKEGTPQVKVIDFGVAKAISQRLTEKTIFTEQGQLIGTPEYMSPEQAEMRALDIDTRSDIYSLGVVLYELLVGALPFDPTTLRQAAFAEIQRIIREQEPHKPSTRLSSLGDASTTLAQKHQSDPRSLIRELRGDLDWITMKALEKDRTRRYETANGLAMDIKRHLNNEPVLAGPPSGMYRAQKFVRRHKVGVAAVATVAMALMAGVVGTTWQAVRATKAETRAVEQASIAQAVNEFLNEDLLAAVAPSAEQGKGKDVLMRDVLDEAAKRIEEAAGVGGRFEDKPLVEASIRATLGYTYEQLGEYPAAEPHLERARELRRRILGEEHPHTLMSLNNLAVLYKSQGRYDEAEPLFLEMLEIKKRVLGEEHPHTLTSMYNLAVLYQRQGRYDKAEPLSLETLEMRKRVLGEEHPDTLASMSNLAALYERQGRYDEAEPLFLETLDIHRRVLGEEHPHTLGAMSNLANLYNDQGRYDEAEPLSLETLEIEKRILGEEHPDTLASMNNLAILYEDQGRYDEAEPLYLETLEIRKRVLGEEHPHTLGSLNNLAVLYKSQGRYDEAEPLFLETLEIKKRVLGEEHPSTLGSITNLASLYHDIGRLEDAEALYLKSVERKRRVLGIRHPWARYAIGGLATVYERQGRVQDALPLRRELLEYQTAAARKPGADANTRNEAAWALLTVEQVELRDPETALPLAIEANEMTNHKNPAYLDTLSLAYHLTGDTTKAIENQKKAIALLPPGESSLRTSLETALADFESALKDEKLPTEQEAVASDKPGQRSSDEEQDE